LGDAIEEIKLVSNIESLIQLYSLGITKRIDEKPKEHEIGEMHLVIDSNLSTILKKVKRLISYHLMVDIIHQIVKCVYYLHDMQVAHLDLKLDDVLSSSIYTHGGFGSSSHIVVPYCGLNL